MYPLFFVLIFLESSKICLCVNLIFFELFFLGFFLKSIKFLFAKRKSILLFNNKNTNGAKNVNILVSEFVFEVLFFPVE